MTRWIDDMMTLWLRFADSWPYGTFCINDTINAWDKDELFSQLKFFPRLTLWGWQPPVISYGYFQTGRIFCILKFTYFANTVSKCNLQQLENNSMLNMCILQTSAACELYILDTFSPHLCSFLSSSKWHIIAATISDV